MRHTPIHKMFSDTAEHVPHHIAIEYKGEALTYERLSERANRLANFLIASGARKGALVSILTDDKLQVITAILACLKSGTVFVPFDASTPEGRLKTFIAEITPQWYITESKRL